MIQRPVLLAAALAALAAAPAAAQVLTRPQLPWRSVRTEHFDLHFPEELSAWSLDVAQRLEAVHAEVSAVVGYAPPNRVTIVVEDPSNQTNGFAYPFLDMPAIALWPTPPDPRSVLGNYRDPAEQLVVHELAHVAHLARPSRSRGQRFLFGLLPVRVGPVARKAPRWVIEGYATYVEGKLTGSGRPHSVVRAAVLRQWALEGRLPKYEDLSDAGGFYGGAMAYLAGSAFLEWLVERRGEESLRDLWRRMSARQGRSFAEAFAGVYGGPPHELYGRFTVEVTRGALAARDTLAAAGVVEGDTVQRLAWSTGDPALSPDGQNVATVLRGAPGTPSRVVVWTTAPDPRADSLEAAARRRLLARDPEDVPAIRWRPPPRRTLATLHPVGGRGHDMPRFTRDGSALLVVRSEPLGDGALRPDLFVWTWKTGALRRVTRGAGLRWPDPAPDGRTAAASRCLGGKCDLVRVDLVTGRVGTIVEAPVNVTYYRPRWAPDGLSIVVSVHERGRWRLARVDAASGAREWIGPADGASRYDAAFFPDGRLVAVSEAGGVANLELLDPATGAARPLTRVTGAAAAPEPDPATGDVFYLSLHAGGLDLMRVDPDRAPAGPVVALSPAMSPAAPVPAAAAPDTLPRSPTPPARAYGLGPRAFRLLPFGAEDADGGSGGVILVDGDPIGRFTATARGAWGDRGLPRGGSLSAVWRGWVPAVGADLFWMEHAPSRDTPVPSLDGALDARYRGAALHAETPWRGSALRRRLRAGASAGELSSGSDAVGGDDADGARTLAFMEAGASAVRTRRTQSLAASLSLHGSVGRTGDAGWRRGVAQGALRIGTGGLSLRGEGLYGVTGGDVPAWERFVVGGTPQPLFDAALLSQRVPMPAVPFGTLRGERVAAFRVSTSLGGLTPYYWGASTDQGFASWHRVAGVEAAVDFGGLNILRIPGARLVGGVGYHLDAPFEEHLEPYLSLTFRP